MRSDLLAKIKGIKIFLFDLEGVLIEKDSNVENCEDDFVKNIFNAGSIFKNCGAQLGIVTARTHDSLIKKLKNVEDVFLLSDSLDKISSVDLLLGAYSIDYENVFYAGDDLLDLPLLGKCGISAAPKDGRREVKRAVNYVTRSNSGKKILDEIIELFKLSKKTG